MPSPSFVAIVTTAGAAFLAAKIAADLPVPITFMVWGDGGGALIVPDPSMTHLVNEVFRIAPTSMVQDPINGTWVDVTGVIPGTSGDYTVREVGLIADDGSPDGLLFAIGSFPETWKPVSADGATCELTTIFVAEIGSVANVTLEIDPSITYVTHAEAAITAAQLRAYAYYTGTS